MITNGPPEGSGVFELLHEPTKTHKGDVFTKAITPADFTPAVGRLGMRVARLPPLKKKEIR